MNRYGARAMGHWREYAPTRYARLEDPEAFFTEMGEQLAGRIEAIEDQLKASTPPEREYMARVAQLTGFRRTAEELVMDESVLVPEETTEDDDFQEWRAAGPGAGEIEDWVTGYQLALEEGREPELDNPAAMAEDWGIPAAFFEALIAAENPYRMLTENDRLVEQALRRRWEALGRPTA